MMPLPLLTIFLNEPLLALVTLLHNHQILVTLLGTKLHVVGRLGTKLLKLGHSHISTSVIISSGPKLIHKEFHKQNWVTHSQACVFWLEVWD